MNIKTAATRTNELHNDAIIELAPGDVFEGCSFVNCEFVGCGPYGFRLCRFEHGRSYSPSEFPRARQSESFAVKCIFLYTK